MNLTLTIIWFENVRCRCSLTNNFLTANEIHFISGGKILPVPTP